MRQFLFKPHFIRSLLSHQQPFSTLRRLGGNLHSRQIHSTSLIHYSASPPSRCFSADEWVRRHNHPTIKTMVDLNRNQETQEFMFTLKLTEKEEMDHKTQNIKPRQGLYKLGYYLQVYFITRVDDHMMTRDVDNLTWLEFIKETYPSPNQQHLFVISVLTAIVSFIVFKLIAKNHDKEDNQMVMVLTPTMRPSMIYYTEELRLCWRQSEDKIKLAVTDWQIAMQKAKDDNAQKHS